MIKYFSKRKYFSLGLVFNFAKKNTSMNTEKLIETIKCGETTTVQFKQEFTSQKEIAREMIALANTRGGHIIFGVKDKTGEIFGLSYDEIQTVSRELGNTANEQIRPIMKNSPRLGHCFSDAIHSNSCRHLL